MACPMADLVFSIGAPMVRRTYASTAPARTGCSSATTPTRRSAATGSATCGGQHRSERGARRCAAAEEWLRRPTGSPTHRRRSARVAGVSASSIGSGTTGFVTCGDRPMRCVTCGFNSDSYSPFPTASRHLVSRACHAGSFTRAADDEPARRATGAAPPPGAAHLPSSVRRSSAKAGRCARTRHDEHTRIARR